MYPRLTTYLKRAWRATVSYTGIGGMPPIEIAGNVLRTETQLKISVRVPPHVDAKAAAEELKQTLEKVPRPFHITYRYLSSLTENFPVTYWEDFSFMYMRPSPLLTETVPATYRYLSFHLYKDLPATYQNLSRNLPRTSHITEIITISYRETSIFLIIFSS